MQWEGIRGRRSEGEVSLWFSQVVHGRWRHARFRDSLLLAGALPFLWDDAPCQPALYEEPVLEVRVEQFHSL